MKVGESAEDLTTVTCGDPAARHKVVGRIEGRTEAEFRGADNPCSAYPTVESAFWSGERGKKGYILCLEPVGR